MTARHFLTLLDLDPRELETVIARAIAMKPELELYAPDKRHPSLAGTYLSACTTYAALFGRNPVGLGYTAGLPADTVRLLQTAAWEAVQAYAQP